MKILNYAFLILILFHGSFAFSETGKITLKEISNEKNDWFASTRENGMRVLKIYAKTNEITPQTLDKAFNAWKVDEGEKQAPEMVVGYGLGILFGDFMISETGGAWMEATNNLGSGLAVELPTGMVAYPIDSVLKRIPPNEYEISFFEPIWYSIKRETLNKSKHRD